MTKPTQKQRIFTTNNFAKHNHNYVNRPKTSKLPRTNTQNHLFSQRHNFQHPTTNSVNFIDYPRISQNQSDNYPFFQQNKNNIQQNQNKQKTLNYTPNYLSSDIFLKTKDPILITYINQIFLNHIHKNNIRNNLDQITHLKIKNFIHKIQLIQIIINQHKCKMKSYYLFTYNNMKSHKVNLKIFSQMPNAAESLQMTMIHT